MTAEGFQVKPDFFSSFQQKCLFFVLQETIQLEVLLVFGFFFFTTYNSLDLSTQGFNER